MSSRSAEATRQTGAEPQSTAAIYNPRPTASPQGQAKNPGVIPGESGAWHPQRQKKGIQREAGL